MADLTQLFRKYVAIIEEARNDPDGEADQRSKGVTQSNGSMEKFRIKDTFVKECSELARHILELRKVLTSLEGPYLSEGEMSEREKDDFDVEARLRLQQYVEKLKYLEKYEATRQQARKVKGDALGLMGLINGWSHTMAGFHQTTNQHRLGILQSVGLWLTATSVQLSQMQRERLSRQRELESIDFNAQLYVPTTLVSAVSHSPAVETTHEEIKQYEETMSMLTQEQLQVLQTEHEELLNQKMQELEKVQKLSKTVIEVASLQNELATHLHVQTQNINVLLDANDDIELDVQKGNRQLNKARERGSKSALMVIYMSIIFGLTILFLDYIN
ncbi:ADR220Wp [Eremothecium gossypii ATCC 10895]|uniref:ADR220Wp n=1 Tax=Eremothecium gossypii (strain ATCC 10895 / CBS 109.51 / FGSC 9923 / NRRL Y-1056) TaxID=284811 RepID=Q759Q3_EREGS|nr:ADR220Wp [Eremothecium gossypii ATCC 10895]AAS52140.2 ADR220Wp [Eremothecium gossypii ATCC 10895]AEY96439.1 FADR220Wp [Eremothecium gossypii FDAG1]